MALLLCHGISGMALIVFPPPGIQSRMAEQKACGVVMTSARRPEKRSSPGIINRIHIDERVL
jgi:hypothetical protein